MRLLLPLLICGAALAVEPGWESLFNGRDLTGWQIVRKKNAGYAVENGRLVCVEGGGGNLLTEREFDNFILRFEFRLPPGGNNGVGIRAPVAGDIAYSGIEIQILDHDHERYAGWLKPVQRHGAIYDVVPPKADALKKPGEWNEQEIVADGSKIKVTLNGTVLVDADLNAITDPEVLKKHPGLKRKSGHIGFLGHNDRVEFRNIRIKRL